MRKATHCVPRYFRFEDTREWADSHQNPQYWLHVVSDGSEKRFQREPAGQYTKRTLHVTSENRIERTRTWNIERQIGKHIQLVSWKPRGEGWTMDDTSSDAWTGWTRKVTP